MVLDPVPPFEPDVAVAKREITTASLIGIVLWLIVAIQRPGLYLPLVQLAAVQQPVKRMQIV